MLSTAALLLDKFFHIQTEGWMSAARWTAIVMVCLGYFVHIGLNVQTNLNRTSEALKSGYIFDTYNIVRWAESETIEYLRNRLGEGVIYANSYGALHARLALKSGINVRGRYPSLPGTILALIEKMATNQDIAYIAWFKDNRDNPSYDPNDLRALPDVDMVAELSDGWVFRVRPEHFKQPARRP